MGEKTKKCGSVKRERECNPRSCISEIKRATTHEVRSKTFYTNGKFFLTTRVRSAGGSAMGVRTEVEGCPKPETEVIILVDISLIPL